jgi:hypothetical protein
VENSNGLCGAFFGVVAIKINSVDFYATCMHILMVMVVKWSSLAGDYMVAV